jgi:hypothetical protein
LTKLSVATDIPFTLPETTEDSLVKVGSAIGKKPRHSIIKKPALFCISRI